MKRDSAGAGRWPGWIDQVAAAALSLLALWVHAARVHFAGGLWRDESAALRLATLPSLGDVWKLFPHEAFPLVVPLGLRTFAAVFGKSDHALRLLGAGVGLSILAALWLSARVTARTVPLAGLALLVPDAAFVVFGDELRGYGLGSLFIVLTFVAVAYLLHRPSPAAALAALAAMLGAVHTLLANTALVGAVCAAAIATALFYGRRRLAWTVFGIGFVAALSLLPYAGPLAQARSWDVVVVYPEQFGHLTTVLGATVGQGPARTIWLVFMLTGIAGTLVPLALARARRGAAVPRSAAGAHGADAAAGSPAADAAAGSPRVDAAPGAGSAAGAAGSGIAGSAGGRRGSEALAFYGALVALLAVFAQLVFLKVLSYAPRAWYYLPLMALAAAAMEPAIYFCCRNAAGRSVRVAICLTSAVLLLPGALPRLPMRMTNVDLIAQTIAAQSQPDDLVLVSPWYIAISFSRYYPRGSAPPADPVELADPVEAAHTARVARLEGRLAPVWITLPEIRDHRLHRYDQLMERLSADHPIDGVLEAMRRTLASGHDVWLVGDLWLPAPGADLEMLPPAPGGGVGWHDYPYIKQWIYTVGRFVQAHAGAVSVVKTPVPSLISELEAGMLMKVSGWHESAVPAAPPAAGATAGP